MCVIWTNISPFAPLFLLKTGCGKMYTVSTKDRFPSLISLMVSVDVKQHVYLFTGTRKMKSSFGPKTGVGQIHTLFSFTKYCE